MSDKRSTGKKVTSKSFYTALCICLAMIGFACYFAYAQTAGKANDELKSIEQNKIAEETTGKYENVWGMQTSIPKDETPEITFNMTTPAETEITEAEQTEEETVATTKRPAMKNTSFTVPVNGTILCEFSNGELVKSSTTGAWQTHNGVDISAENGTQINSMYNGTVTSVTNDALWGVCIEIDHGNGITARYCGLSKDTDVSEGEEVKTGSVIGYAGHSCEIECEQEPHIHFEVIKNGSYVDPIKLVNGTL